jgi:hypothetical protein
MVYIRRSEMRTRVLLGPAVIASALLVGAGGAVAGELTCVFSMKSEVVGSAAQGAPVAGRPAAAWAGPAGNKGTHRTVVGLAKDSIAETREGESTMAYHFPSKRMYVLDLREKTYAELSLYGSVAFCVNELVHRRALGQGFAAAGFLKDPSRRDIVDQFTVESLFSRRLPQDAGRPDAPAATVVRRGKEWEFDRGDRRFVRFLPSDHTVPPDYRRSWIRFLVHQCRIHPTIREQIVQTAAIPDILEFTYFDGNKSCTVTYRLESVGEGRERWAGVPAGFTPKVVPGDRLGRILAKLDSGEKPEMLRTRAAAERFVDEALARGNALDAYLGWLEYSALAGGDAGSRATIDAMAARILAAKDGRVSSLRARRGKPEELSAILETIDGIDRRGLRKDYQLEVQRGFILLALGRVAEANDGFLKALDANPRLLNCYRQLGDNHLRAFQTVDAWRCFDAIRRVDPEFYMLKDVKALEARFEKDFPEDF